MPNYSLTDAARADLKGILDYTVQTWGRKRAVSYLDGLDKLASSLAESRRLGRSCDDLREGLLAFPYESHVLYYVETRGGIAVIRVLHKSMNSALHFNDT